MVTEEGGGDARYRRDTRPPSGSTGPFPLSKRGTCVFRAVCDVRGLRHGASSALTRQALGWEPTDPELIADLAQLEITD